MRFTISLDAPTMPARSFCVNGSPTTFRPFETIASSSKVRETRDEISINASVLILRSASRKRFASVSRTRLAMSAEPSRARKKDLYESVCKWQRSIAATLALRGS